MAGNVSSSSSSSSSLSPSFVTKSIKEEQKGFVATSTVVKEICNFSELRSLFNEVDHVCLDKGKNINIKDIPPYLLQAWRDLVQNPRLSGQARKERILPMVINIFNKALLPTGKSLTNMEYEGVVYLATNPWLNDCNIRPKQGPLTLSAGYGNLYATMAELHVAIGHTKRGILKMQPNQKLHILGIPQKKLDAISADEPVEAILSSLSRLVNKTEKVCLEEWGGSLAATKEEVLGAGVTLVLSATEGMKLSLEKRQEK